MFMFEDFIIRCPRLIAGCLFLLFIFPGVPAEAHTAGKSAGAIPVNQPLVIVSDGLVSLTVKSADLVQVLREIARRSGIDLTIGETVGGRVTADIRQQTIPEVLRRLTGDRALTYEYLPAEKRFRVSAVTVVAGSSPLTARSDGSGAIPPRGTAGRGVQGPPVHPSAGSLFPGSRPEPPAGPGLPLQMYDKEGRLSYLPDEVLVRFRDGVAPGEAAALHAGIHATVVDRLKTLRVARVKLAEGFSVSSALRYYRASEAVAQVERHALRYPAVVPGDTYYAHQWGLPRIRAPEAWERTTGSEEIIIAVLDTGVNYLHPDLRPNIWANAAELNGGQGLDDDDNGLVDDIFGYDFAESDADVLSFDDHGTHVSGIAAAAGDNSRGIAGVSWRARIMPLKIFFDDDGSPVYALLEGLIYARDHGARIVNCSFTGEYSQFERDALVELAEAGILVVCAAGNESMDLDVTPVFPAAYTLDNILSVAAGDRNDGLADFSNWGGNTVDLAAPGTDIYSTIGSMNDYTEASVITKSAVHNGLSLAHAGTTTSLGVTGRLYDCGYGEAGGCPPEVAGNLALIERGPHGTGETPVLFAEKAATAQQAGAAGVIIYNDDVDTLDVYGGTLGIPQYWVGDRWLPAISVSKADGMDLLQLLEDEVTLVNYPADDAGYYAFYGGTSMAAPMVAGIAAQILAVRPDLDYAGVKKAILDAVEPVQALQDLVATGGRLDGLGALLSLLSPGDLSGNGVVGLEDAILALRINADLAPSPFWPLPVDAEVDDDGRTGLSEAIHIFQTVGEFR